MESAERMDECIIRHLKSDDRLLEELYSLVRYGSFERSDFVPGLGDLDYFVVIEDDDAIIDPLGMPGFISTQQCNPRFRDCYRNRLLNSNPIPIPVMTTVSV